jgi:hypothetical protein
MHGDTTIENLITDLSSFNDLVRVKARYEPVAAGKPALTSLVEALKNPNHLVRWEAAKALGEIGDSEAAPSLVEALEDEEFEVHWRAAEALIRLSTKGLSPLLHALIRHADSAFLREGAHRVLHELAKGELRAYLTPVLIALEGFEPAVLVPAAALCAIETMEESPKTANKDRRHFPQAVSRCHTKPDSKKKRTDGPGNTQGAYVGDSCFPFNRDVAQGQPGRNISYCASQPPASITRRWISSPSFTGFMSSFGWAVV